MLEFLIDDKYICETDKIAVGVSGGADSMLLLWALIDKKRSIGFDMVVIHVNHHIRKETSSRDQKFVEDFCKKRKIKQITVDIDVQKLKVDEKCTIEEAARNLRYIAFEKVMKENKLNKLFLAHHKNDQAETILMHIFRGSGLLGASGIRESNKIVRPILNISKNEILKLCKDHAIEFVEDETNANNNYARNFVRNEIIPKIEIIYPNVVDALFKFGKRCEEIQNYIEQFISDGLFEEQKDGVLLKDGAFDNPSFLVREYIKKAFEKLGIFEDIESKHYLMVYQLQKAEVNKQIDLPHKTSAKRTYSGIKFLKKKVKKFQNNEYQFVIGDIDFDGIGKIETRFVASDEVVYGEGILYADYNKISNTAVWRTRKDGDVFAKLGTGSKKLNDYFTDKKIEVDKRDSVVVLASSNQILAVLGEDISENVKIDGVTDKIVAIKFYKN